MKFLGKVFGFLIILGLLSAVLSFVAENFSIILAIVIVVVILAFIIGWNSSDKNNAQYIPIYMMNELNLPDNENYLLTEAIQQIGNGITSFSPHDMGVRGIETTSTYYKNLFDKGYFDKERRGLYRVNPTLLNRALTNYLSLVDHNMSRVNSSKHKKQVAQSIDAYEIDKQMIRLTPSLTIPYAVLSAYISESL